MLNKIDEVAKKINSGKALLLAGSETALSQLPKGNWIGGTTSYFIDADGGTFSDSSIFVNELPEFAKDFKVSEYTTQTLPSIGAEAPEKGFTVLILPAGSAVHTAYAEGAPRYEGFVIKPVVGWVSGVPLPEVGRTEPKVFNGKTGESSSSHALAMHECSVNGKPMNFAHYLSSVGADLRLPLTANYNGSVINVSIQATEEATGLVRLYAPVFAGVEYTFAEPVNDYVAAFESALPENRKDASFACNCILNYLYANLGGHSAGSVPSMVTFGEIAHQLLNQTLVRLLIHDV